MNNMERNWDMCIAFHGHPCPVLATGYRVAVEALKRLEITDLHKQKLICISENSVCGVDSIQIMLNCTLAKGNIIIRDNGKQVYTVVRVSDGKGLRFSLKEEMALPWPDPDVWPENVGWEDQIERLLNDSADSMFDITEVEMKIDMPYVGHVFQYNKCVKCGELVSEYAQHVRFGKIYCNDCYVPEIPLVDGKLLRTGNGWR